MSKDMVNITYKSVAAL